MKASPILFAYLSLFRSLGHPTPPRGIAPASAVGQKARMLVIDDVTLRLAGKLLLDGASARIPDGARVGLVGRNGVGKTTLFRAIAGDMAPERGTFAFSPRLRIGRLAQEAPDG